MKRAALHIIYIIAFLLSLVTASAKAGASDSLRISLLTCGPGEEIYTLFGHTAIRCENLTKGTDVVYNYGLFDFGAPNFVLRFALGETDYQLGRTDFRRFAYEYQYYGRWVSQQVLNLTEAEKQQLLQALQENHRPENRVYRYNFFFDNCATRPRDKVEESLSSPLKYADVMNEPVDSITFRHLIYQYSVGHPWSRFGMNLCMGPKADRPITRRESMFVPFLLEEHFMRACMEEAGGETRPLVLEKKMLIPADTDRQPDGGFTPTPLQAALLLFILTAACSIYGLRKGRSLWGLDLLLFFSAGIAGCILAFLACLSQHPAVSPNYLLLVFHPFHLLALPWIVISDRKHRKCPYLALNLIVLTLFIALWPLLPQKFPAEVLPLALCLLIRSVTNLLIAKR